MNIIKSIFISSIVVVWVFFTYIFSREAIVEGYSLTLVGLFFSGVVPLAYFAYLLGLKNIPRTSRYLTVFTILITLGVIFISIDIYQHGASAYYLLIASTSLLLWVLYVYWYSIFAKSRMELKVGDLLPELTFTAGNQPVSTSSLRGKKLLLIFYRGNWCALCVAQIKEISAQYKELEQRGVEVLLISPQPSRHSMSLAKRLKVNFQFFTDVDNSMARKLMIDQNYGIPFGYRIFGYKNDTVLPTVIIIDEAGKILFLDQTDNYRLRPEPETFFEVLDV